MTAEARLPQLEERPGRLLGILLAQLPVGAHRFAQTEPGDEQRDEHQHAQRGLQGALAYGPLAHFFPHHPYECPGARLGRQRRPELRVERRAAGRRWLGQTLGTYVRLHQVHVGPAVQTCVLLQVMCEVDEFRTAQFEGGLGSENPQFRCQFPLLWVRLRRVG